MILNREICRETNSAFAHEWLVKNARGDYAATSIGGALTRRQHGLLVTLPDGSQAPHILVAKLDEELEVEGHIYKLGTNEYQNSVINPDGFLYLQQVTLEGSLAEFVYESGRFQLTKSVWMAEDCAATYVHYALAETSAPVQLTLVPLCDYRASDVTTQGNNGWHFTVRSLANGLEISAGDAAPAYRILASPAMTFTPLDLWYWRFQLRADANASTDLYVPGLMRVHLSPGGSCTIVATTGTQVVPEIDVTERLTRARSLLPLTALPESDKFTPELFRPG